MNKKSVEIIKTCLRELSEIYRYSTAKIDNEEIYRQLHNITEMLDKDLDINELQEFREMHDMCPYGKYHWRDECNDDYCKGE